MSAHHIPDLAWHIVVHGYRLPDSAGTLFDSDWLKATLHMRAGQGVVKRSLKFLLVEELERLGLWLEQVRCQEPVDDLELVDPALRFKLITRNRVPFVKVIHGTDPKRRLVVDQLTAPASLNACVAMVQEQIASFPCRCGHPHDTRINGGATDQPDPSRQILTP